MVVVVKAAETPVVEEEIGDNGKLHGTIPMDLDLGNETANIF